MSRMRDGHIQQPIPPGPPFTDSYNHHFPAPPPSPRARAAQMRQSAATVRRKHHTYVDLRELPETLFPTAPRRREPHEGRRRDTDINGEYFYKTHELVEIVAELHYANKRREAQQFKSRYSHGLMRPPPPPSRSRGSRDFSREGRRSFSSYHHYQSSYHYPSHHHQSSSHHHHYHWYRHQSVPKETTTEKVSVEEIQSFIARFHTYRNRKK